MYRQACGLYYYSFQPPVMCSRNEVQNFTPVYITKCDNLKGISFKSSQTASHCPEITKKIEMYSPAPALPCQRCCCFSVPLRSPTDDVTYITHMYGISMLRPVTYCSIGRGWRGNTGAVAELELQCWSGRAVGQWGKVGEF